MKYYAQLLRCLKDCYFKHFQELNIDLNYFILTKNELSLHFLRQKDNLTATVRAALRVYGGTNLDKMKDENAKNITLDNILKKNYLQKDLSEEEKKEESESDDDEDLEEFRNIPQP